MPAGGTNALDGPAIVPLAEATLVMPRAGRVDSDGAWVLERDE